MNGLRGLAILLLCQSAGEGLVRLLGVRFPGPVVGLLLLLVLLNWGPVKAPVQAIADTLLGHLSLLFVPVGVGVMTHLGLIASHGVVLVGVVVLSTWLGLAATALVLRALLPRAATDAAKQARP
jgi:holin-like protein